MNMPATGIGGGHVRLSACGSTSPTTAPISRGWATQAGQRTVAGVIDEALSTVFRTPVVTRTAGEPTPGCMPPARSPTSTSPPTHVAHAYPRTIRPGDAEFTPLVRRLARLLPTDVRIRDIVRAPAGFDARFSALRRHYTYRLSLAPYGVEPAEARFVTPWSKPLDLDAMAAASRELLGLNDFAAFCRRRPGATTIRDLQRLEWVRDGMYVTAYVTADAFCWNMVRSLVGAMLAVGEGRRSPEWTAGLLGETSRSSDFAAAPARGLTLVQVDYPADDELEARNLITRDVREGRLNTLCS